MANRIVFLSRLPPLEVFSKALGIDYLSERGFKIFFLDLSYLIDGADAHSLYKQQAALNGCETIAINSLKELETFVRENSASSVYIDFVGGLSEFNLNISKIFKILKYYNIKYYIISNGAIPSGHYDADGFVSTVFVKIKKVLNNPRLLFEFLTRKLIVQLIRMNLLFQRPHRIFGMEDSPAIVSYIKKYGMSVSEVTSINSRDYDAYLEYVRDKNIIAHQSEACVFLDEDHTNHPDFFLMGIAPLNEAEYVASMNSFFDYVEKRIGCSVVIAAHPKSRFSATNHPYGGREFIQGNTLQLVAQSKLVIAHSSTSISFPVLFNKPIALVVTGEMENRKGILSAVRAFAKELGLTPINVHSTIKVNALDNMLFSGNDYRNYLHKFVKNKKSINKLTWEIVGDAVLKE